ncbi:sigma-54-dependent transcriptional regulator [Elusimicrobiota bacterium]
MSSKPREKNPVFVVEDDPDAALLMRMTFEDEGYSVQTIQTGEEALRRFEQSLPCLVILDLKLPDIYGMDLLEKMKKLDPDVPVLILTGYGEIDTAVEAIKKGAFHYLSKPCQKADLLLLVRKALEESRRERQLEALQQRLSGNRGERYALGKSSAIHEVLKQVERVAPTDMTVILEGDSGVGKEVLARILHRKSLRSDKPFIALDCSTLPENLAETELFGYERGAFTGADKRKLGQFEIAHAGTLFLDEIANLALPIQAKLLRVIQERRVQHLGGKREIPVDVRIITASNRSLPEEVRGERFREDLYHRLNEFTVTIPPLRERPEDIPELVEIFLEDACRSLRKHMRGVSEEAMLLLQKAPWPGNVRQLKNTIRASALMAEDTIKAADLVPFLSRGGERKTEPAASPEYALKDAARSAEKEAILAALRETGHNKSKAARLLKIDRSVLYDKMRRFGIPLKQV